ncbi:hypothetical protein A2153_03655 [Candidatus Gottesmanbacteria bacterium RBG_16_38_7b]|uniref:Phosphoribosyltransferase domain-containing protein n=2 Tax=Candidatus Gottesmaniibacteriota TaxID=1752720 RepID=A0A1F5YHF5_9BACT|nr:MAG: hypothetical protein A2153_03655 [Candidatus Gottesmanbacteria bacterium RBG_16_38_7b]OGG32273.1 MAG: hypothetical protein A3I51_02895 [Candidatus Gottesmanbacteria bacterium RIFCSPLOWO2_02_FULL_38_8]
MFENREAAGRLLAAKLKKYKNSKEAIVIAIPRGGIIVGAAIAQKLNLPLEAISVKKLGAPFNPELAIGAVAQEGNRYIDWVMLRTVNAGDDYVEREVETKFKEVDERIRKYKIRSDRLLNYSIFILTDDGIATGATTRAALNVLNNLKPKRSDKKLIILAVPVISDEVFKQLEGEADEIVVLEKPTDLGAVGQFYNEFNQVNDATVLEILEKLRR